MNLTISRCDTALLEKNKKALKCMWLKMFQELGGALSNNNPTSKSALAKLNSTTNKESPAEIWEEFLRMVRDPFYHIFVVSSVNPFRHKSSQKSSSRVAHGLEIVRNVKETHDFVACCMTTELETAYPIITISRHSQDFRRENKIENVVASDSKKGNLNVKEWAFGMHEMDVSRPVSTSFLVGIEQIWVDKNHRRNGIASQLLDYVRYHRIYGFPLPKGKLCFHQPSTTGRLLAQSYFGCCDFLVYS